MKFSLLKIAFLSLFLTACQLTEPQFSVPKSIKFQGKTFEKVTHNQIDEMQQLLYLPDDEAKDPNHWNKGILLFLDKNSKNITLADRVALRQNSFNKQKETKAKVEIVGQELKSEVLYPPTERFNDVLLEVSRGRTLQCGYGQMQYSDKRLISAKEKQNLTAYQPELARLALVFSQLAWQISCE
ncbi:ABC transporter ATPase [Actinobacillus minor]|uniref:ABC transporter ATPase n=1 Tax=Actinobacillus minor TaxID=51047 RepID=UPI0023F10B50|nr:ABC transporter ATPase [Actinobacillus minor]MDD6909716.1 ABC transporter ATPase [Actinobacillus minor]MDY4713475.1 ABC transporter ATPase [Actinobacillus minor]